MNRDTWNDRKAWIFIITMNSINLNLRVFFNEYNQTSENDTIEIIKNFLLFQG